MRVVAAPVLFFCLLGLVARPVSAQLCGIEQCSTSDSFYSTALGGGEGIGGDWSDGEIDDDSFFEGATESFAFSPDSFAPNMIGDLNAISGLSIINSLYTTSTSTPTPSAYRYKMSEDNSPFPRNRILFGYNRFDDAVLVTNAGVASRRALDRYTIGLERAFWDRRASIQVHLPFFSSTDFAAAVPTDFSANGGNVGNLQLTGKYLLYSDCCTAMSVGLAATLPTGSDVTGFSTSIPFAIRNESVHLMPFVGFYRSLGSDRAYVQSFLQLDLDVNGNPVSHNAMTGRYQDQNLFYFDVSAGYWLYKNSCCDRRLKGVASILEFHYTTTIQDTDVVTIGDLNLRNSLNRVDIPTLTAGANFQFSRSNARVGFVVPLDGRVDATTGLSQRPFDWEFAAQYNIGF